MFRKLFPFAILVFLLAGCAPQGEPVAGVETQPVSESATFTLVPASETPAPTATEEPVPPPAEGTVRGAVCYPSEFIPAMTAYFRNVETDELVMIDISENQATYEVTLPVGGYVAFAYLNSEEVLGGAFSQAVPCGMSADCSDHSLVVLDVQGGETVEGADLCDWYAPDAVPAKPGRTEPADGALAGLVLYDPGAGLWQVQADGSAAWAYSQTGAKAISADGSQVLFVKEDDIWLAERSGVTRNLTQTPERFEFAPQWWPANPSVVVFGSVSVEEGQGPSAGHLSMVQLDGSGYQVLEAGSSSLGLPALSPDGQTIASDTGDQAWLYGLDGSREPFDPVVYGLEGVARIASPGYSPDGSKLAWWVGVGSAADGSWKTMLVVFDLQAGSYQVLREYVPVGGGGWSSNPVWSPDGQWLATIALGDMGKATLWAFDLNGGVFNLGRSGNPVWSPDSQRLVYIEWTDGPYDEAPVKQLSLADGTLQELDLQPGRIPFAWTGLP